MVSREGESQIEKNRRELFDLLEPEYPPQKQGQLAPLFSIEEIFAEDMRKKFKGWELEGKLHELTKAGYDREIDKLFNYLSATKDLEISSERTAKIQTEIIDKMVPPEMRTRVVIMRKGKAPEGFVTPEGTIFISESLINCLDSYDELAAVLAHELSHLILKTSFENIKDKSVNTFGIGWVHEASCDQHAINLLEKGGFKVTALATAIEKFEAIGRGLVHQSNLMRATQNFAALAIVDRNTSSNKVKPIDPWLKYSVSKTNEDLVDEIIETLKNLSFDETMEIASKLHQKDLENFYERILRHWMVKDKQGEYIYITLLSWGLTKLL